MINFFLILPALKSKYKSKIFEGQQKREEPWVDLKELSMIKKDFQYIRT